MTSYEKGFLAKCAEHGVDGRILVKSAKEKFLNTYTGRTSVSAGAGALVGLLYEALKKKQQKKYWLKSILNGALGGAVAGAGSLAFRKNVLEPTIKIDLPNTNSQTSGQATTDKKTYRNGMEVVRSTSRPYDMNGVSIAKTTYVLRDKDGREWFDDGSGTLSQIGE